MDFSAVDSEADEVEVSLKDVLLDVQSKDGPGARRAEFPLPVRAPSEGEIRSPLEFAIASDSWFG